MVPAVAVKLADVAPDATVTDAGTESALVLLERPTVTPPAGAGWLSEAAQVDEAPPVSDVGLHESPVNAGVEAGGDERLTVPPVPVTKSRPPEEVVASGPLSPIGVVTAEVVIVTVITAAIPFCIGDSFIPDSRHVSDPALEKQLMVLPAAVALAPGTALTEETLPAEYVSVHWSAAGSLPAGEFNDKFSATVPPGAAVPDERASVSCPNATPGTIARKAARNNPQPAGFGSLFSRTLLCKWSTSRSWAPRALGSRVPMACAAARQLANFKILFEPFIFNTVDRGFSELPRSSQDANRRGTGESRAASPTPSAGWSGTKPTSTEAHYAPKRRIELLKPRCCKWSTSIHWLGFKEFIPTVGSQRAFYSVKYPGPGSFFMK